MLYLQVMRSFRLFRRNFPTASMDDGDPAWRVLRRMQFWEKSPIARPSARPLPAYTPPGQARIAGINWRGVWTLYVKETRRFLKVMLQTLAAPVLTTLLFLAIFSFALGALRPDINGIPFAEFLAPGLIMMAILQNAFANTSSSLLIAKIQGNIVDYLMPPLSPGEINAAMNLAGLTRGVAVGAATWAGMVFFVNLGWPFSLLYILFYTISGALMLSLLGTLAGIWSEKFDHLASITNFVIMPLSFLSGTFYSVEQLPEGFYRFSQFNPFFYVIDGMRFGFTGHAESNLFIGVVLLTIINLGLWLLCYDVLRRGWRLRQ